MMGEFYRKFNVQQANSIVVAEFLFFLGVGSLLSRHLSKYSYYLLAIAVILVAISAQNSFLSWYKKDLKNRSVWFGLFGTDLLLFFFGIQNPQIDYKIPFIVALVFLAISFFRGKK